MSHIKLMSVDDSKITADLIDLVLAGESQIDHSARALSAHDAMMVMESHAIDVATVHLTPSDAEGIALIELLTAQDKCGVIVISDTARIHPLAMRLGATACFPGSMA